MDDTDVLVAWIEELSSDDPNPAIIAALEATAEAQGWTPVVVLDTLLARTDFDPDVHPRGKDGKFIEKFGIVKLLGDVFGPDGRKVNAAGRRGVVEGIDKDPRTPGRPNIRVRMIGQDGKPGPSVHVKPDGVIQAPEKARLDKPLTRTPNARPDAPQAPGRPLATPGRPLTTPKRTVVPETPEARQARLDAEEKRAIATEARTVPDAELDYQTTVGPSQWRDAVQAEKLSRLAKKQREEQSRQQLIDSVNEQAAGLSTTDAEERAVQLDQILAKLRFSIIDTDKVHDQLYPPENGSRWTAERTEQHEAMWDALLADIEKAGIPKDHDALVLGGLPGAGKSFSLRPGEAADNFNVVAWEPNVPVPASATHVSINPDVVKEMLIAQGMLPEGLTDDMKPMEKVTFLHEESSYLAKMFSARLGEEGYNVVLDNTFDSEGGMLKRMAPLAREGYTFRGLFADIPVDESLKSARDRYIRGALTPEGGRFVPSSVQGNRKTTSGNLSKNRDAFDLMTQQDWFTEYLVIDNTGVTEGKPKKEIVSQGTGTGAAALAYRPGNEKNLPKVGPRLTPEPEAAPTIDVSTIGGPNRTSISPAGSAQLAADVMSGKPIEVDDFDVDDVVDHFADSENPVDLTLMSQFSAMRAGGIPRSQMPQISKANTAAFQERLRQSNVEFGPGIVDPLDLKATQSELDGKTVGGIMRAARAGEMDLHGHPIWVSNDGYVLDGHHRWGAASALSSNCGGKGCVQIPVIRVDMPMSELLQFANTFNDDMGVQRLGFGESLPGGQISPDAPAPVASGMLAAAELGPPAEPPQPDEQGNYEMATDEEDGVNPADLEGLAHGDGSAFGYEPPAE